MRFLVNPLFTPLDFIWFCLCYSLFKEHWWGVFVMIAGLAILAILQPLPSKTNEA